MDLSPVAPRPARSSSSPLHHNHDLLLPPRQKERAFSTCAWLSPNSHTNPVVIKKKSPLPPSPAGSPTAPFQCPLARPVTFAPAPTPSTPLSILQAATQRLSADPTSPPPLLRLPPEIILEIVSWHPPNLVALRRTCRALYSRLDEPALAAAVPVAQAGIADAGRHAVSCGCDDPEIINRLLDAGTEPYSLLEWACLLNRKRMVRHLVLGNDSPPATPPFTSSSAPAMAQPSSPPRVRPTQKALCWSSSRGHVSVVRTLLKAGCRPDEDSLRSAARNNHLSLVRLLLDAGAAPSSSALESALRANHFALVELLLEAGAPPSDEVLSAAAYQGSADVVRLLLDKGARVSEMAIDYASWGGHEAIVRMLEEHVPPVLLDA